MKIAEARAVVTGGASGLGNAVARHVAAAGGQVTLARRAGRAGTRGGRPRSARAPHFVKCDVTSEAEVIACHGCGARAHGRHQSSRQLRRRHRRGARARPQRAHGGRVLHQGHPHQSHRHLSLRQGGGRSHAAQHAERGWRARPLDPHLLRRRLRRTDRPGRLLRNQGRGHGHDAAHRPRVRARSASAAWPSRPASFSRR